jgi:hypothetical protein
MASLPWRPFAMLPEDLPFRVIRVRSEDEIIVRANSLIVVSKRRRLG